MDLLNYVSKVYYLEYLLQHNLKVLLSLIKNDVNIYQLGQDIIVKYQYKNNKNITNDLVNAIIYGFILPNNDLDYFKFIQPYLTTAHKIAMIFYAAINNNIILLDYIRTNLNINLNTPNVKDILLDYIDEPNYDQFDDLVEKSSLNNVIAFLSQNYNTNMLYMQLYQAIYDLNYAKINYLMSNYNLDINYELDQETYVEPMPLDYVYDIKNISAIQVAIYRGDINMVKYLINKYNANIYNIIYILVQGDPVDISALGYAVYSNNSALMDYLWHNYNFSFDRVNRFGEDILMVMIEDDNFYGRMYLYWDPDYIIYKILDYINPSNYDINKRNSVRGLNILEMADENHLTKFYQQLEQKFRNVIQY